MGELRNGLCDSHSRQQRELGGFSVSLRPRHRDREHQAAIGRPPCVSASSDPSRLAIGDDKGRDWELTRSAFSREIAIGGVNFAEPLHLFEVIELVDRLDRCGAAHFRKHLDAKPQSFCQSQQRPTSIILDQLDMDQMKLAAVGPGLGHCGIKLPFVRD